MRAFIAEQTDDGVSRGLRELDDDELGDGDVVIRVEWSSVNYKDALAVSAKGRVAKGYPLVPGIDLAGEVIASDADGIAPGDAVLVCGGGAIGQLAVQLSLGHDACLSQKWSAVCAQHRLGTTQPRNSRLHMRR